MCRFLIVSDTTCLSNINRLTPSVIEEVSSDGGMQLTIGLPSERIRQARDMIERVGRENCPGDSSWERIKEVGRRLCDPTVWVTAMAKPIDLCANHECGERHILADCQYQTLCSGCGASDHTHDKCTERCSKCKKRHSTKRHPDRWGQMPALKRLPK